MENGVAMIGPTNLLATVRTISSLWQVWRQNVNAQKIANRGGKLFDKFSNFVDDLIEIGERIDQSNRSWHNAMNKLKEGNGNLLRQAELLKKLGAKTSKSLRLTSTAALADDGDDGNSDADAEAQTEAE
jgi:DNA recombination protein RmuC